MAQNICISNGSFGAISRFLEMNEILVKELYCSSLIVLFCLFTGKLNQCEEIDFISYNSHDSHEGTKESGELLWSNTQFEVENFPLRSRERKQSNITNQPI